MWPLIKLKKIIAYNFALYHLLSLFGKFHLIKLIVGVENTFVTIFAEMYHLQPNINAAYRS